MENRPKYVKYSNMVYNFETQNPQSLKIFVTILKFKIIFLFL